jgi:hypothetical protein
MKWKYHPNLPSWISHTQNAHSSPPAQALDVCPPSATSEKIWASDGSVPPINEDNENSTNTINCEHGTSTWGDC